MAFQLKEAVDFSDVVERAARRRVLDVAYRDLSQGQVDSATSRTMEMSKFLEPVRTLSPGSLLSSSDQLKFVKDAKYSTALMTGRTVFLEEEVTRSAKEAFSLLDDIQKSISTLDVELTEDEIRTLNGYSQVHYNSFVRAVDMGLDYEENPWQRDFKTGIPFLAGNVAKLTPEAGVTLPVISEERIPFVDVVLVGEESDVGDSLNPIVSTDPRNVMFEDRTFRHVIVRKEFDETSRKYKKGPVYCTLQFEFPGTQLVNTLYVKPLGYSSIFIDSVSYINDNAEQVKLEVLTVEADRIVTLMFEPVKARYLKIKFVQYAPIERTKIVLGDPVVLKLNDILRGHGWSQYLPEQVEEIEGAIYDFSLEAIWASVRTYESLGVFSARARSVDNLVGVSFEDTTEAINISYDQRTYGRRAFLGEGEVLLERYLGMKLYGDNGETLVDELIPVRDGYPVQKEFLPVHGSESRLKLFPDVNWNLDKVRVFGYYFIGIWFMIAAEPIPGIENKTVGVTYHDSDLRFMGPTGHELTQGPASYVVVNPQFVLVGSFGSGTRETINLNTSPYMYGFFVSAQESPINVYEEDALLTIGTDYHMSFDDGATWVDEIPYGLRYSNQNRKLRAGDVRVRIIEPDYDKIYLTTYRVARDQLLGGGNMVRLKNGRVLVDRSLRKNHGQLNMVYVLRAQQDNPYITPVLLSYSLRVREQNVS
jgi:hypothetical protein